MSSGPVYSVKPVQDDGTHRSGQKVASEIHNQTGPEDNGPLKEMLATHQHSLYKYISWEDPVRTLGSYLLALSTLFGAHYLPLTRWALKAGATAFGGIFVTEFVSRIFSSNTFLKQIRPKVYKTVPEQTLNATLKDIHDFVQYSVVKFQRIAYGHELDHTFIAFAGFTALYWLAKALPPFWLSVLCLTTLYTAPLVASPRGREVVIEAKARAEELGTAAAENGKQLAQDSKAKATELAAKAQEVAADASQAAAETVKNLPERSADAIYSAPETAKSILNDAGQYIGKTFSGAAEGQSGDNEPAASGVVNKVSQLANNATEAAKNMAPNYIIGSGPSKDHGASGRSSGLQVAPDVSSTPRQISGEKTSTTAGGASEFPIVNETAPKRGILNEI